MRRSSALAWAAFLLALTISPAGAADEQVQLIPRISVSQPAGWSHFVVPQLGTGVQGQDPLQAPSLLDPTQAVYFNWAVTHNPAVLGYWTDQLLLDGVPVQTLNRFNADWESKTWYALDVGPHYLRGGRHVLRACCDIYNQTGEDYLDRYDNERTVSFLWTPPALTAGSTYTTGGAPPPPPGCLAFAMTRASAYGWVGGMTPSNGDDYDLVLYDDFTSSTSGLSNERARSATSGDSVELIVGAGDVLPETLYPAVWRSHLGPAWGAGIEWQDATGRTGQGDAYWSAESLAYLQGAQIYEVTLDAGVPYPMSVWRVVGSADLALAVFPPTPGGIFGLPQAVGRSHPIPGQDYDALLFTPLIGGKHLIVVYRPRGEWGVVRYRLAIGSQAVDVAGGRREEFCFFGAHPNPILNQSKIAFLAPAAGHARLTVHDVSGRIVATLLDDTVEAGWHDVPWEVRDDAGRSVPAGLYWARLEAFGRSMTTRLCILH